MSIEKIKERIISKAEREAENFLSEEKSKIDKERKFFAISKKEEFDKKFKDALLKIENEAKRKIDQKNLEIDREILSKKRIMLDELFENAVNKFTSLDKKTYRKFIESLILSDAPEGSSRILVNEGDVSLFDEKFIAYLNKKLGKNRRVSLSNETVDIKGGCIIRGNEIEIDDSIETLLSDEREQNEMFIAKNLFGENK